LYVISFIR